MDATLLVLPLGSDAGARSNAALIARLVGCSVLVIPVPPVVPARPRALRPSTCVKATDETERPISTSFS
jgi:hypothetical protein